MAASVGVGWSGMEAVARRGRETGSLLLGWRRQRNEAMAAAAASRCVVEGVCLSDAVMRHRLVGSRPTGSATASRHPFVRSCSGARAERIGRGGADFCNLLGRGRVLEEEAICRVPLERRAMAVATRRVRWLSSTTLNTRNCAQC